MKQQRRYKEPQDTLWGKFLSGFMAVVFAMSTLTLIPIASAINGEPNEAQIQQQEELADQTSGKDEKAVEPAADEQKLEPVELLSIASVEDEDDAAAADVTLKVKAQNATVTYNGNDAATELVVPADKDVKFTVKAADGFTLGAAAVKLADAKGETTLTPNAGEYTVAADRVADGVTIVVTAEAVAGSTNTDAAEPSTPAPSTELGEKMEMAKSVITSVFESVFGGTSTLDVTGEQLVAVGKKITLMSNQGNSWHSWSSSDSKIATVSGSGKTATVTGKSAGTVTITHAYIDRGQKEESFTVTVTNAPESGTIYPVYVYAEIDRSNSVINDTDLRSQADALIQSLGIVLNGNEDKKWYTLGELANAMPTPPTMSQQLGIPASEEDKSRVASSAVNMTRYNGNKFPLDVVSSWSLKTSDGANDYSGAKGVWAEMNKGNELKYVTVTWHLDAAAKIVKYTWKATDDGDAIQTAVGFEKNPTLADPEDKPARPGYTFSGWNDPVPDGNGDYIITAKWIPNNDAKHAVSYRVDYYKDGVLAESDTVVSAEGWIGEETTVAVDKSAINVTDKYVGYTGTTTLDSIQDSFSVAAEAATGEANVIRVDYVKNNDAKHAVSYRVDYYKDGVLAESDTVVSAEGWIGEETTVAVDKSAINVTDKYVGYTGTTTLDSIQDSFSVAAEAATGEANVIRVDYVIGSFPYTVNYVDEDGNTLLDPKTGAPQEFESVISSFDEVVSIPGYVFESADKEQLNIGAVEADNVITLTYAVDVITDPNNDDNGDENPGDGIPDKYQAVVNYESANDAQGTVNLAQKVITFANNATSGTVNIFDGVATNPTAGFVFDGWTEDGNAVASNLTRELQGNTEYTFIANWALDVIGTDPTDPGNNAPDGIADKYQLVVTYAAIAGTIDGPARYVLNKYDAAGNLAEDGVAVLTAAQIPGATADDGYGNGVWNNEPLANMELTDDTAFVIAFTALPAAAVVVPPLAPVAAAAPAAAAAAAATILDDGVPLATIDDDENALAAFEEIHCWTHWLMIFGALVTIVYGLAVLYRRRHGIRDMDDFEGDITGGRKYDAATEKNPAAGNAFQAM